jgi:hypothetical protein
MESNLKIPTWYEAERQVVRNTDDALDRFVYHNEPASPADELTFRYQLQELVDLLTKRGDVK